MITGMPALILEITLGSSDRGDPVIEVIQSSRRSSHRGDPAIEAIQPSRGYKSSDWRRGVITCDDSVSVSEDLHVGRSGPRDNVWGVTTGQWRSGEPQQAATDHNSSTTITTKQKTAEGR